jgi:hypothetical protein
MGIAHHPGAIGPAPNGRELHLVSSKKAACMLGVCEGTLRYWRCVQTGPPWIKLGRRALYDVADLVEFVSRGRRNPSVRTMEVDDVSV